MAKSFTAEAIWDVEDEELLEAATVHLAGWLPHYLTLPLHSDSDHFAMLAQLWSSAGKVPYRDVFSMQFPGEIYLYWVLGKLRGWGNAVAFRAADAGMLLSLCVLMTAWSRR